MLILILKSICLALAIGFTGMAVSATAMFIAFVKAVANDSVKGKFTARGLAANWFLASLFWAGFYFFCTFS